MFKKLREKWNNFWEKEARELDSWIANEIRKDWSKKK